MDVVVDRMCKMGLGKTCFRHGRKSAQFCHCLPYSIYVVKLYTIRQAGRLLVPTLLGLGKVTDSTSGSAT